MKFKEFIEEHREESLSMDLKQTYPQVSEVLNKYRDLLSEAEFESEIEEVRKFAEKGVKNFKSNLQRHIRNNARAIYKGGIPPYILYVRGYLEYQNLYAQTIPSNVNNKNQYPAIFIGTENLGFEKFDYLFHELSSVKFKTRLSTLYHYFKHSQDFQPTMTQLDYIEWCERVYDVSMSKVMQLNFKMQDLINKAIPSILSNLKN